MATYKFVIRNPFGERFYKSMKSYESASQAQIAGNKFLRVSRQMDNRADVSAKENYVDVV